jgi:hypothetical protein
MSTTTIPATVNFRLYPHATFSEVQTLRDSDGNPIDLSGHSALMHFRRDREDQEPLFALSSGAGGITLGGTAGTIALNISAADTGTPQWDSDGEVLYHDILLTAPSGFVARTYQGVVIVLPGITRP